MKLVRCPSHNIITSNPSDNHETESGSALPHRRTANRVDRLGAVTRVARRGCVPRAIDFDAGRRPELQPNHGRVANHSTDHLAMEPAV